MVCLDSFGWLFIRRPTLRAEDARRVGHPEGLAGVGERRCYLQEVAADRGGWGELRNWADSMLASFELAA
jgi:hypothetical protein